MDFKPVASCFRLAGHIWIAPLFLFPPLLFFLSLFANLKKGAHWSSLAISLRQPGNKEQSHAVLAPASSSGGSPPGRAEQGDQSLQQLPPVPLPWVPWKLKYLSIMECLVCLLALATSGKNSHPNYHWARIQYPAMFCFKNTHLGFPRECGQPSSTTRDWYGCNTNTPSMLPCSKKAAQKLLQG